MVADSSAAPPAPAPDATAARLDFSGARLLAVGPEPDAAEPALDAAIAPPEACALLTAHSFGDTALLVPDAASARRLALETIRTHHRTAGRPKRRELLVLAGGLPLPPDLAADAEVATLSDDPGAVEAAITPRTAGLFIASLRRAAGLATVDGGLLATLRTLADDYGLPLVFDETDAGLGRTGMAFAHEWRGVTPDLMLVGEGAGLPVAALVLSARHARALPPSRPPVDEAQAAAAGEMLAAMFAEGFEARIQALGWLLEDRLAGLRYARPDLFREVVGMGLAQGLACTGPAAPLAEALAELGLDVAVFGDVLAFLPPLDVSEADITAAADILAAVVAERVPEEA
ncbi:aminotransferase class III-fold pyridoxal phosphate-dependent enzyme [Xanthobacter sp. V3C-3]|uniref:aminotransferase class III-fold pyridoxal phosphate-dependent enzyme n=1 Tax=Xanthobacter lutulentifluminis TaxID=3119935 RepID=UPI00372C7194